MRWKHVPWRVVAALVALGLAAVALWAPTASGALAPATTSADAGGTKGTIAIMFPNASQPIVQRVLDVAKQRAAQRGYKFLINDPGNDLNKQVGVIETWIQQKVDAIVSVVPEPEVFEKIAAKARASGIVWVTYAATLKNEDGFVSWPHYSGGLLLGKAFGEWLKANSALSGKKAKVALLTFEKGQWSRNRRAGIEAGLKKYAPGRYRVVAKQDTLTAPEATSIVSTMLQANPDLNAVLCVIDTPCEGAYQALVNAGHRRNDPKLFVGGLDGTPRAFQLILGGTFYRASSALRLHDIGLAVINTPADIIETKRKKDTLVPYSLLTRSNPSRVRLFLDDWRKK